MTYEDAFTVGSGGRAASVIQKLAARQAAAAAERERQQQQHERESDPRENSDLFFASFSSRLGRLQAMCNGLQQQAALAGTDEAAKQELQRQLEELGIEIAGLEQDVAAAAYFLPPYDLRSCTAQVQELRNQAAETKQQLQPKRKFAFSSKSVTRKTPLHPTEAPAGSAASVVQQQLQDVQLADQAAGATSYSAASRPHTTQAANAQTAAAPPPSSHDLALIAAGQGAASLRGAQLVYGPGQQQQLQPGQAFVLHDLQDCTVFLVGPLSALRLQHLRRCRVYAGPVAGATFVSGVSDCLLMVASQQVRIHDAARSDLYLRTRSHPIIEHSSGLRFAPFPFEQLGRQLQQPCVRECSNPEQQGQQQQQQEVAVTTSNITQYQQGNTMPLQQQRHAQQEQEDLQQQPQQQQLAAMLDHAQLSHCSGMWQAVQDFGWVKGSQSPNWAPLPEQQRQYPQPLPWR